MIRRYFLNVVPRAVQWWALVLVCCAAVIALVAANLGDPPGPPLVVGAAVMGGGVVLALLLLSLGFVYADARNRAMPPVLWTLVALLVPNLLGYLLYFAIRKPLAGSCAGCGRAIGSDQPFCSWCGSSQVRPLATV